MSITTSTGTVVTAERVLDGSGSLLHLAVICDHPDAPDAMRHHEVGRIIFGGFQPAVIAAFGLIPETLRAIADLIDAEDAR